MQERMTSLSKQYYAYIVFALIVLLQILVARLVLEYLIVPECRNDPSCLVWVMEREVQ